VGASHTGLALLLRHLKDVEDRLRGDALDAIAADMTIVGTTSISRASMIRLSTLRTFKRASLSARPCARRIPDPNPF
jgi:hypothetical protein